MVGPERVGREFAATNEGDVAPGVDGLGTARLPHHEVVTGAARLIAES